MRRVILVLLLVAAVGVAAWTVVQRHRQTQWLRAYLEASDSFARYHYRDAEAQIGMILPQDKHATSHEAALAFHLLARIYYAEGRAKEAEPFFEQAIGIFEQGGPSRSLDLAKAATSEGRMYLEQGRLQEADRRLQQAVGAYQQQPGKAGAELGSALHYQALLRMAQKRNSEADPLFEQAIQIYTQNLGPEDVNVAQAYLDLAAEYRIEKRLKESQEMDRKALAIQERVFGKDSPGARETRARLPNK